jgi:hypothetical protein
MIISPVAFNIPLNFILTLCTLGWAIIILAVFLVLLFIIIIVTISKPISRIGVYHRAKPFHKFKEPLFSNIVEIFLNNLILTIPLYFTIVYLLKPENFFVTSGSPIIPTDIINEFKTALVIIPGYLLSIRLLTNPVKNESNIPFLRSVLEIIKSYYSDKTPRIVLKERIISFYFSLTATLFVVMVMIWLYKTIPLSSAASFSDPLNLNFWGKVVQSIMVSFIPQFDKSVIINLSSILLFVGAYILALFILTATGEIILTYHKIVNPEECDPEITLMISNILNVWHRSFRQFKKYILIEHNNKK